MLKSLVSCVVKPVGVSALLLAPRVSFFVLDVHSHFLLPKKIRERLMKDYGISGVVSQSGNNLESRNGVPAYS